MNLFLDGEVERTADLSEDGCYRYGLTRRWLPGGSAVLWIMLNPSTADATRDDATIRKCIAFSKLFGANALSVINLFAFRATNPVRLIQEGDPVGHRNLETIEKAVNGAELTVAAWGDIPKRLAAKAAMSINTAMHATQMSCLGTTRNGWPRHPSRVAYSMRLVPWQRP